MAAGSMRARWRLVLTWLCFASAGQGASPPSCPQAATRRCALVGFFVGEYVYTVDGVRLTIEYTDGGYFRLKCLGNLTLDNPALPRFNDQLRVNKAYLTGCSPPASSYAAALAALKVFVLDVLSLNGSERIGRAQLAGLEHLSTLMLHDTELEPDALAALPALRRLHMDKLRLPPAALAALPPALTVLELVRTGAALSAAQLRRLPQLAVVVLRDNERAAVEPAGALQVIMLEAPASYVSRRLLPSLRKLVLVGWDERAPKPWKDCGALEELITKNASAEALPGDWLRACPRLRVLRVTASRLAALPAGMLDATPALRLLDLSGNLLHVLPSGLFARNKDLVWLDLSTNNFSKEVFASLETVTSLKTLRLNNNIHLTYSCGGVSDTVRGTSKLRDLKHLTKLFLRNTSAEVICRDWRDDMLQLKKLDLSKNKITAITYSDLQFRSAADVDLTGNNVTRLQYTELDYERVLRGESLARANFHVDFALTCDCWVYWAAATLRARPQHVRLQQVKCTGGGGLAAAPVAELPWLPCAEPGGIRAGGAGGAGGAPAVLLGGALAALLAAAALLALLAHPALCLRLKFAMHAFGWLPGAERDDGRRFDAFVCFSHGDERFVREQLVARLEGGQAPYRLCVHYRDWAPGGWIPAQIAASVRASRRTLAVVSEHFLRSPWARAELREAHALAMQEREPRLVLLLLDDPARLPLDDKLRRYLAHNTCVRWGEPWFWQKLRLALPRTRPPAVELAPAVEMVPRDVSTLAGADQESLTSLAEL